MSKTDAKDHPSTSMTARDVMRTNVLTVTDITEMGLEAAAQYAIERATGGVLGQNTRADVCTRIAFVSGPVSSPAPVLNAAITPVPNGGST